MATGYINPNIGDKTEKSPGKTLFIAFYTPFKIRLRNKIALENH